MTQSAKQQGGVRIYVKFFFLVSLVASFMKVSALIFPVFLLSRQTYRWISARLISFFSGLLLKVLGCRVHVEQTPKHRKNNHLIVSNHLSYLDVLVLSKIFPSCYVTSQEIRESFGLGQITTLAGCLFVERRSRSHLSKEISSITRALKAGLNVVIFPEGTSTNGDTVLRFRQPLFQAAIDSGTKVLPATINYKQLNRQPITVHNRDQLFWYGDMTFWNHFTGLAAVDRLDVSVTVGVPINAAAYPDSALLSIDAQKAVARSYISIV